MTAVMFTQKDISAFLGKLRSLETLGNHPRAQEPEMLDYIDSIKRTYIFAKFVGTNPISLETRTKLSTMIHNAKELEDVVLQYVVVEAESRAMVEEEKFKWIV